MNEMGETYAAIDVAKKQMTAEQWHCSITDLPLTLSTRMNDDDDRPLPRGTPPSIRRVGGLSNANKVAVQMLWVALPRTPRVINQMSCNYRHSSSC